MDYQHIHPKAGGSIPPKLEGLSPQNRNYQQLQPQFPLGFDAPRGNEGPSLAGHRLRSAPRDVAGESWRRVHGAESRICPQWSYPSRSGARKIRQAPATYIYPFSSPGNVTNAFKRHCRENSGFFSSMSGAKGPSGRTAAPAHRYRSAAVPSPGAGPPRGKGPPTPAPAPRRRRDATAAPRPSPVPVPPPLRSAPPAAAGAPRPPAPLTCPRRRRRRPVTRAPGTRPRPGISAAPPPRPGPRRRGGAWQPQRVPRPQRRFYFFDPKNRREGRRGREAPLPTARGRGWGTRGAFGGIASPAPSALLSPAAAGRG